jgi:4-amino-4-deoxy-L-arabinose transferase-like glycosyltransferase
VAIRLPQPLQFAAMRSAVTGIEARDAKALPADGDRRWWAVALIVVVLAGGLFFARLGTRALWASEFRWGEIAREMQLTHNYFWPTMNGRVYYDKPLGSYWLVVGATYLTDGLNETAARLPSAVAGLLGVALLILIVRRLYDLRTGVFAALILATSFSYVFFSRLASADVETIAGELGALAFFLRNEQRQDGWWVVGLWIVMAVTSLTKGLLGFVLPIVVIGSYSCLAEGWAEFGRRLSGGPISRRLGWLVERNRWLFNWKSIPAITLGLAIYLVPFAVSRGRTGSDAGLYDVYRENIVRFFHPFDHRGPIYLYVYIIFLLMAPWSALLPAALVQTHHRRHIGAEAERSDRFVLVFFWATFIFFTLSGSRRSYYLLPILPAAAILVARLLALPSESLSAAARHMRNVGYFTVAFFVAVGVVAFIPPSWILPWPWSVLPPAPDRIIFGICWAISFGIVVWTLAKLGSARIMLSIGVAAYLFMGYIYVFAMPMADAYRGEKAFAEQTRRLIGSDTNQLALFRTQGPLYYLDLPGLIPEFQKQALLAKAVRENRVRWVILRRRDVAKLAVQSKAVLSEPTYPWDGKQHHLNTMVLLKVGPELAAKP